MTVPSEVLQHIRDEKAAQTKIKSCPFCGIAGRVEQIGGRYTVGCVTHDCMGHYRSGKLFNDQLKAIEAWNRRADSEEIKNYKDAIQSICDKFERIDECRECPIQEYGLCP